jgi:hypothetical protein
VDRIRHHARVRGVGGLSKHRLPRSEHPVAMDVGFNIYPAVHRYVSGLSLSRESSLVCVKLYRFGLPGTDLSMLGIWRRDDGQKPSRLLADFDRTRSRLLATCTMRPNCSRSKPLNVRASRFGKNSSVSDAIAAQPRAHSSSCSCSRSVPPRP